MLAYSAALSPQLQLRRQGERRTDSIAAGMASQYSGAPYQMRWAGTRNLLRYLLGNASLLSRSGLSVCTSEIFEISRDKKGVRKWMY